MLIRVSTDRQDVARQRSDMERLKARFGVNVIRTLELHGVSGTATLEDAQVQQLLNDQALASVDGIGVSALDRLLRPAKRFGQTAIIDRFMKEGKRIWSVREGEIDPASDEGNAKCWQACSQASAEFRELARRTMDGRMDFLRIEKKPDHGSAPYGYVYVSKHKDNGGRFQIVEGKAEVVRMVFRCRAAGWKTSKIVNGLNERGILSNGHWGRKDSATGKSVWVAPGAWTRQTVIQMLRNPTYKGEHVRFGIVVPVDAVVSVDLWDAAQRASATAKERSNGRPPKRAYLLSNFLFCSKCGHRMRSANTTHKNPAYRCHHQSPRPPRVFLCDASQVQMRTLDPLVWGAVWEAVTEPGTLLAHARAFYTHRAGTNSKALHAEAKDLAARRGRVAEMVEDGITPYKDGREKIRGIDARLAQIETELKTSGNVFELPTEARAQQAQARFVGVDGELLEFSERREVLEGLQELHIGYYGGDVIIEGWIPMPSAPANKCNSGIDPYYSCSAAIPFRIVRRVA
jgi:DNA invertase Pin-like site-specific DNA recombinase